jgi:hypothetical protein
VLSFTNSKRVTGDESIVARMSGLNYATRTTSLLATIRCLLLLFLFGPHAGLHVVKPLYAERGHLSHLINKIGSFG